MNAFTIVFSDQIENLFEVKRFIVNLISKQNITLEILDSSFRQEMSTKLRKVFVLINISNAVMSISRKL